MSSISDLVLKSTHLNNADKSYRANAVAAALEVIAARSGGASGNVNLAYEFEQLSAYADQIQEALKTE